MVKRTLGDYVIEPGRNPDLAKRLDVMNFLRRGKRQYVQGQDYAAVIPDKSTFSVVGIYDESTAINVQSKLVSYAPENKTARFIFNNSWGVRLYEPEATVLGLDEDYEDYSPSEFRYNPELQNWVNHLERIFEEKGVNRFVDYSGVDTDQDLQGLDVELRDLKTARKVQRALIKTTGFPYSWIYEQSGNWRAGVRTIWNEKQANQSDRPELVDVDPRKVERYLRNCRFIANSLIHYPGELENIDIFIGYGLIKAVDPKVGGLLLEKLNQTRRYYADAGIPVPLVRVRDCSSFSYYQYQVLIGKNKLNGAIEVVDKLDPVFAANEMNQAFMTAVSLFPMVQKVKSEEKVA